ncbi:AGAP011223-PA-like protein [Anopheles sinensis]|uniref:AGAP011223-PA-like protein n=1 Tax=Anopheles sinensis TaxID=74873 RepID=A0A084WNT8_ANOSI|nr:AGAP011223-PA-like protein [Anopheles sinensis]
MARVFAWLAIVCVFLLLCPTLPSAANSLPANASEQSIAGYGFEVMMAKLDYLQYKLHEMELGRKERDEEVTEKLAKLENSLTGVQWAITRLDRDAGYNLTVLSAQSRKMMLQQTACANHEQMRKEIAQLASNTTDPAKYTEWYKQLIAGNPQSEAAQLLSNSTDPANETNWQAQLTSVLEMVQSISNTTSLIWQSKGPFKSCKEAPAGKTGVYRIQLAGNQLPIEAFCEQSSFGGGWLVIQYRFNGALDFNQNWTEYENGFGSLNQEFWFGLAKIHQLTSERPHELVVEFKDFSQNYGYARYKEFAIGNANEQYKLQKVGAYEGTGGDSLKYEVGSKFSTKDRDSSYNCVAIRGGGWCSSGHFNLNGKYLNKVDDSAMYWYGYKSSTQGLAYSRMMIRGV